MISAETGSAAESAAESSGTAAVAMGAVTNAANQPRPDNGGGGQAAEVAGGVARHREQPAAGLMGRGL